MGKIVTSGQVKDFSTWQRWESNPAEETLLETWVSKIQKTANPLIAGTYKFAWNLELRVVVVGSLDSLGAGRFLVDATVKSHTVNDSTEWAAHSGWDFNSYAKGDTPSLEIQFRRDPTVGGDDKIEIRRAKMSLERMGD